jgi:hypothetical protein
MVMQAVDLVVHKLKLNTHWEDYYRYGFYSRDKSWSDKALYVSDKGSYYWPWEGNSLKFDRLFIRKSLQKSVLVAEGLPTPRMLLKAGSTYAVNSAEKLASELARIDVPFLTKFEGGGSGVLNLAFEPANGQMHCGDKIVDAHWIWNQYQSVADAGFLVEERVWNHENLARICPTSLNTVRLNLVKTADGKWHQLRPMIKFGRVGSHVDNTSAGGLFAGIDSHGCMGTAFTNSYETFDRHPDTGATIRGELVPFYDDALELAVRASRVFGFMATIGWDVGITPSGPTIIEANPAWHSRNYQDALGPFLTPEAAAGLISRRWWTPWDKTHMYPHYMDHADGGWWQRYLARRRTRLLALAAESTQDSSRD